MQYVNLGATGLRVSRICLGMMSFGNDSDRPWCLTRTPLPSRRGAGCRRGRYHVLRHC